MTRRPTIRPTRPAARAALAAALAATPVLAQDTSSPQEVRRPNPIDLVRPDAPELAHPGPYAVGVTTMDFVRSGVPDVRRATATSQPTYDRPLTVEVWYPAADGTTGGGTYETVLRDGETPVTLSGSAVREAAPMGGETFPLVIVSHGYPGNRFLMSPLAETLASRGYVVASIDHTDSTYSDQGAFGSTLLNRPRDQLFVLDAMAGLSDGIGEITDGDTAAVVGYSMGGYGALIFAGAGVTEASTTFDYAPPGGLLAANQAGTEARAELDDPRLKAAVAFAPWGNNAGFFDAEGLAGIDIPLLLIAGSADDVSGYEAIRGIFDSTTGTDRALLTFENANHNAGAPMPAPAESWAWSETLGWPPFEHYADPVWDSVRMNNIAAHFVSAFLDRELKGAETDLYLDLVPVAADGVWSVTEDGLRTGAHTYWLGFPERTAAGLRFETRAAGE
ncbi:alpha/beta hydrolase family protein [Wenxinia saemankumensis]|uniref:Platelet-activating factor acetylhydrolase, isoform II n=1 Tax=Wenxinia saemankumensis TaxID=1447782 RepID=A0A1M6D1V4_9RHOB|nr:dienelactone hydrolase [Wenxinia saemankumensis]SHI67247.1 Platelet-activating factor acetylhydrolase, isoform II [Wenxinia saemankumensis]